MKPWQNIVCSCCAMGALVVAMAAPHALAAETTANTEKDSSIREEATVGCWQRTGGVIQEITAAENGYHLLVKTAGNPQAEIIFLVPAGTPIVDHETGLPLSANQLQTGEEIYVTYGPAMTMSLPPQTVAYGIVARVPAEKAPATFIEVGEVQQKDGQVQVVSADGNYILSLTAQTPVQPLLTKNIVTIDDIQPGCTLFAWFEVMTLRIPAQATPERVVLASCPVAWETAAFFPTEITVKEKITINGKDYSLSQPLLTTETTCQAPVRVIGEALGFTVDWQQETAEITLTKGAQTVTFAVGQNSYQIAEGEAKQLPQAPILQGAYALAPIELWQWIAGAELSVVDGMLQLQTK